ncbi:hypothetical protein HYH03_011116 [Edaphochlamys debaryana]|uniref:Uncharacterized protein n=1 Tax=Edaphochlamys debaryana TaxID=47281 RepID=A0A835XUI9_9CHLO|nr:hypothetical protein HYH03_011116 [Edaphochlamys debaryana]|eukprot:KAG2490488.1 hypothetical protein HYH03_011116 [Edaphochlamys debaryana]
MRFTLRRVLICGCAALKEKDFPEEEPVGACKNGVRRPSEADKQGGADERAPYSTEDSTASEESAGALDSSAGAFGDAIGPLRSVASSATPAHPHGARSASWASRGRTQSLRSGSSSCSGAASARPDARCSAPGSARSPNAMSLVPECGAQSCYYNPLAEDSDGNELCDGDEEGFQSGSDDDSAPLPERRSATALTSDDPATVSSSISTSGLPSPSPKSSPKPAASPSQLKRLWVPPPPTATKSQPELAPELPSAEPATPEVRSSARGSPFAAAPDATDSADADAAELSDGGAPPCLGGGGGGSVTRPTAPPTPPRVAPAAELDADRDADITLLPADAMPLEQSEPGASEAASEPAPPSPTPRSGCPPPPCCPLSPPAAACTSPVPTSGANGAAADCDCPFRASPSTAAAGLAAASAADDGADDASGADRKAAPAPAAAAGAAFAPETPPLAERQLAGLTSAAEAADADAEAAAAAAAAAERDGAAAAAAVTAAAEAATAAASAGVAEVEQSMAGGDEVGLEGRMVSLRCRQPDYGSQPIAGTASAEAEAEAEAGALMEALAEAERLALAAAPAGEARREVPSPPQPQPAAEEVAAAEVETELIAWGSGEVSEAAAEAATCSAAASEAAAERASLQDAAAAATAPAAEAPGPSPAQAAPRRTVPSLAAALSWRSLPPASALRRSQSTGCMAALALRPGRPCPASAAPAPTAAAFRGTASVLRRGTTSTPTYGSLSEAVSYIFMPVLYNDAAAYRQSAPACLTRGTLDSLCQPSIPPSTARPTSSAPADGVPVPSILPTTPGQAPPGQGPLPESPSAAVERAEAAEAVAALGGAGLHPHHARLIRPPCACPSDSCDCFLRSRMGTRSWTDGGCGIGLGLGFALAGMDGGSFAISAGGASATASPVGVVRPSSRAAGASGADAGVAATGSAAQVTSEAAAAAGAPAEEGESNDPGCSISGLCMTRALIRRLGLAPSTFAGALPQPAAPAPAAPFRPALPTCHEVAPSSPFAAAGSAAAAALLGRDADVAMALDVPESPRPVTWSDSESNSDPMSPGSDPESGSESGSDASDDSLDSVDGPLPMPPTAAELARRQAWRCWQQRAEAAEPHPHPHSQPQPQPQPHAASASTVHGVAGRAEGEAEPEPQLEAWTPLRERWAAMARRKAGGRVASLRALHEKHVRAAAAAGVSKPKPGPGPGPGPGLGLGRSVSGRSRRSRQSDFGHVSGTAAAAPLRQRTSYHGAGLGLAPRLSATGAAMVAAAATAVRAAAGPEARAAVEPVSEEQPEEACAPVESWRPLRERVAWRRVAGGRA